MAGAGRLYQMTFIIPDILPLMESLVSGDKGISR